MRVRAAILLWWAARYGLIRQLSPARRITAAERAVALWRGNTTPVSVGLADALVVLGQCRLRAAQAAEAEAVGREALAIYGDACRRGRADAYHLLAEALNCLGRFDEALTAAESAIADYRLDAKPGSTRLIGRLVAALYVQSVILVQLGRPDEALRVGEESVRLIDGVPLLRSRWTWRTKWRVECHLAGLLWRAGRYAEALRVGDNALITLDVMVRFYPAYSRPIRGELLAYLAQCHGQLGHLDDAAAAAEKSVADYRELGEVHQANLALALEIYGERLVALDRHADADMARSEASEIYTSLAHTEPDRCWEPLYRIVDSRIEALWKRGEHAEAVAVGMSFLPVLQRFATDDPATYEPLLAESLSVLAGRASMVDRDDALEHADRALSIARRLTNNGTHDRLLAQCLHNRAVVLEHMELNAEAASAAQEAVRVWRRLAEAEPTVHELGLANCVALSASILRSLERDEEAVAHWMEAADILRRRLDLPTVRGRLADVLHDLALVLSAVHQHGHAIDVMAESIEHRGHVLNHEHSAEQRATLACALRQRSFDLNAIRRYDEAQSDIAKAIEIFRVLASADPDRFEHEVARSEDQALRQRTEESDENRMTRPG